MVEYSGDASRSGRAGYMKLSSSRRMAPGVALPSFSQAVHGLVRGKWQLLEPRVHRCHLNPVRSTPGTTRLLMTSFNLCCVRRTFGFIW